MSRRVLGVISSESEEAGFRVSEEPAQWCSTVLTRCRDDLDVVLCSSISTVDDRAGRTSLDRVAVRNRQLRVIEWCRHFLDSWVRHLEQQLQEKKVDVTFTDKLRKHLAKKGFDPLMGARPMQRLIQDMIRKALADELLFGRLTEGGRLTVDLDDKDEVLLDITPLPKKEGKGSRAEPEEATAD